MAENPNIGPAEPSTCHKRPFLSTVGSAAAEIKWGQDPISYSDPVGPDLGAQYGRGFPGDWRQWATVIGNRPKSGLEASVLNNISSERRSGTWRVRKSTQGIPKRARTSRKRYFRTSQKSKNKYDKLETPYGGGIFENSVGRVCNSPVLYQAIGGNGLKSARLAF